MSIIWLDLNHGDLDTERRQLTEEGRDISPVRSRFSRLAGLTPAKLSLAVNQARIRQLLDDAQDLPMKSGREWNEPSDLPGIRRLRRRSVRGKAPVVSAARIRDAIQGAWLGRCIGCLLGKPIEGVHYQHLKAFLSETGQWPLSRYIKFNQTRRILGKHKWAVGKSWFDKVNYMPSDDDTNYTTLGLLLLEREGERFSAQSVGNAWLGMLPSMATCTAERVAYRNLLCGLTPPDTATHANPYREWIGAQIRADIYGYVNAGDPRTAAEHAWRDASLSHTKNGIYGTMWVAAMLAAAVGETDPSVVIQRGLDQIPSSSRLHAALREVLAWRDRGVSYDEAVDRLHDQWNEKSSHDWCHTVSNAVVVAIGLLWGEGDFGLSICRAVQACFDTDCNGATVGSIVGMMSGTGSISKSWSSRMRDTLHTGIAGHNVVKVSDMAERSFILWKRFHAERSRSPKSGRRKK